MTTDEIKLLKQLAELIDREEDELYRLRRRIEELDVIETELSINNNLYKELIKNYGSSS
jgi:hypothetical protein